MGVLLLGRPSQSPSMWHQLPCKAPLGDRLLEVVKSQREGRVTITADGAVTSPAHARFVMLVIREGTRVGMHHSSLCTPLPIRVFSIRALSSLPHTISLAHSNPLALDHPSFMVKAAIDKHFIKKGE